MPRTDVPGLGEWLITEPCANCCKGEALAKSLKRTVIIVHICSIYKQIICEIYLTDWILFKGSQKSSEFQKVPTGRTLYLKMPTNDHWVVQYLPTRYSQPIHRYLWIQILSPIHFIYVEHRRLYPRAITVRMPPNNIDNSRPTWSNCLLFFPLNAR